MKTLISNISSNRFNNSTFIFTNAFEEINTITKKYLNIFYIIDINVYHIYQSNFTSLLSNDNFFLIKNGEYSKSIETYSLIINKMLDLNIDKKSVIIGIGGGVTTDICGFVSSTYKRGIDFILVPTTLLAMIDASIGGKNGLNFNGYKNQIGTIAFPSTCIIDTNFLKSLNQKEIANGFVEIIKIAIIKDEKLLIAFEKNDLTNIDTIIEDAITLKLHITDNDVFENKMRLFLNLGHTIGHALESYYNYKYSHGQCVALGMLCEIDDESICTRLFNLFKKLNIELPPLPTASELIKYINKDKKNINQVWLMPKVTNIGQVFLIKNNISQIERMINNEHHRYKS